MKRIYFDVIKDSLERRFGPIEYRCSSNNQAFGMPYLITDGIIERKSDSYFMDGDLNQSPMLLKGSLVITVGPKHHKFLDNLNIAFITVLGEFRPLVVFGFLSELYESFDSWKEDLDCIISREGSINDMLEISLPLLNNPPFYFGDRLDEVCAVIDSHDELDAIKMLPHHEHFKNGLIRIEDLNFDDIEFDVLNSRPRVLDPKESSGNMAMAARSVTLGPRMGILGMTIMHPPLTSFQLLVLETLGDAIEQRHLKVVHQSGSAGFSVHGLLRVLMSEGKTLSAGYRDFAEIISSTEGPFQVLYIEIDADKIQTIPASILVTHLEKEVSDSRFIICGDNTFAALISRVNITDNNKAYSFDMPSCIQGNGAHVGVSLAFKDSLDFPSYELQAMRACEIGREFRSNTNVHPFFNTAISYILQYGSTELSPSVLCHPGLANLLTYNQTSSVDYYDTLRQFFIAKQNVTETARRLHIQRNTMLFRLNKIKEITGIRFEDDEEMMYFRISLFMLSRTYRLGVNGT